MTTTNLKPRNILVNGKRSSMRLEDELWSALTVIAKKEGKTIHGVVSFIEAHDRRGGTLTSSVRAYIVNHMLNITRKRYG
ncbi:MAG: ribbon-helix-helix domain-containing protein [Rhodospirillaceae bacterium]